MSVSKMVKIVPERLCCLGDRKKHVLAPFGGTPRAISLPPKKLCECSLWSHTGFVQIRSGLGSYNGEPFGEPPKVNAI